MKKTTNLINYKIIFWDFDGVIKESVEVKTNAFRELFRLNGQVVMEKITIHHINNGGMSRFKKIPIYLSYAGIQSTEEIVTEYCNRFAETVENAVINCDWVPGVKDILEKKSNSKQRYVLVTATPQDEIERILERLNIINVFSDIFGAPMSKSDAINMCLNFYGVNAKETIMIGDSKADYEASQKSGTNFLLRRTPENMISMDNFRGDVIFNFLDNEK
jgi:HAD superfamily hydrolase (TIGR01549 family)